MSASNSLTRNMDDVRKKRVTEQRKRVQVNFYHYSFFLNEVGNILRSWLISKIKSPLNQKIGKLKIKMFGFYGLLKTSFADL